MSKGRRTKRRRRSAAAGRSAAGGAGRRAAAGNAGRQRTGRGMTRQQRQKQLYTRMLIAAAVIVIAVIVLVVSMRARLRSTAESAASQPQTEAAVQNTETAEATAPADDAPQTSAETTAETPADVVQTEPAAEVQTGQTAAGTAAEEPAAEETSGSSMAEQSLVEKLSVEAKKNLETEKIRLAKEEEERQKQAEEEAKKAEVKDRDELSELPVDELVEYLRNKEVPEELIGFMEEYPEAREFVTDYLYQPETPPSKDISGEVVKGQFPHFLQWDKRWGYELYGGSYFAVAGCGPTAMSVVYSGLTGKTDMNPYAMSQWAEEQGYYIVGEGTSWEMMWAGAADLGLYAWEVDFDEFTITSTLQNGFPIIAAMSPGGDFTSFGHFIVLTGIDDEGNVSIRDSNSIERTERTWTLDELLWQTAAMWAYNYDTYY